MKGGKEAWFMVSRNDLPDCLSPKTDWLLGFLLTDCGQAVWKLLHTSAAKMSSYDGLYPYTGSNITLFYQVAFINSCLSLSGLRLQVCATIYSKELFVCLTS